MLNAGGDVIGPRCPTCQNHSTPSAAVGVNGRHPGTAPTDISLLTAIDGAVGHKMRIWSAQKRELEARLEAKTKELQTVIAERQAREDSLKKEMEDSKRKLEDRLRDLDEQVKTFRVQCESRITEEQQRSSRLHQDLSREVSQREHELAKAKTRLAESGRTIGVLETERVKLNGELRECRMQKDTLQSKLKEMQRDFETLQSSSKTRIDSVREVEDRYQHKVAEAEKRSLEHERLLGEHVIRIEGLQKALTLARQVQKQTVDDKRKLEEEMAKKDYDLKRISAELDGTKLALTRLTSEHSTCACRMADLQKALNSIKVSNCSAAQLVTVDKAEQKQQVSELRRQVTQLGSKLESCRAERNELECRLSEAEAAVCKWRDTSESLKNEIARLSQDHEREIADLKMQACNLELMLKKANAQEAMLKNKLQEGLHMDSDLERQLETARQETNRLRTELFESRQKAELLAQERASLFDQMADNGRLRFELEQARRRLDESAEETKQLKRLSSELRLRKNKAEEKLRATATASPATTISPTFTTSTGKIFNNLMANQPASRLSADSPTFVAHSSMSNHQQHQQQHDTVSLAPTTMTSPAFRHIPLSLPSDNPQHSNPPNSRLLTLTNESQLTCSTPNLAANEDLSKGAVVIETTEKSTRELLPSSIISEWERYSSAEAKSLEVALSSQLAALTAASEKILNQICLVTAKKE